MGWETLRVTEIGFGCVWQVDLAAFDDSRGHFYELFSNNHLQLIPGISFNPVQSNISVSRKGALRGIHYSLAKGGQSKWVTCLRGKILDCVIDLRENSPTFGKSRLVELSSISPQAIYIGAGIGHAFLSLENESMINYLLDNKFDPSQEFALNPLDPTLEIMWPKMDYLLSEKDSTARSLRELIVDKKLPKQEY